MMNPSDDAEFVSLLKRLTELVEKIERNIEKRDEQNPFEAARQKVIDAIGL